MRIVLTSGPRIKYMPSLIISSPKASPIRYIISQSNEQHAQHSLGKRINIPESSSLTSYLLIPRGPFAIRILGMFNRGTNAVCRTVP